MAVLDFANSYVTFFTRPEQGSNIARIQIDAACTVRTGGGEAETFYLIAPCRSEYMYRDGPLFQMPNYEFSGIFTERECLILRTHWTSDREAPEYGLASERFERVAVDLRPLAGARRIEDRAEIVAATLANAPLVARTEVRDAERGVTAVLEYPVKTMNVVREPAQFQVDTGPLIVPSTDADAGRAIERFDVGHVVYHQFDRAEFVLRRPAAVGEREGAPVMVTDYTAVSACAARNEIWAGGEA